MAASDSGEGAPHIGLVAAKLRMSGLSQRVLCQESAIAALKEQLKRILADRQTQLTKALQQMLLQHQRTYKESTQTARERINQLELRVHELQQLLVSERASHEICASIQSPADSQSCLGLLEPFDSVCNDVSSSSCSIAGSHESASTTHESAPLQQDQLYLLAEDNTKLSWECLHLQQLLMQERCRGQLICQCTVVHLTRLCAQMQQQVQQLQMPIAPGSGTSAAHSAFAAESRGAAWLDLMSHLDQQLSRIAQQYQNDEDWVKGIQHRMDHCAQVRRLWQLTALLLV